MSTPRGSLNVPANAVQVKALYDYVPDSNFEGGNFIKFKEGDIITVLDKREDGWWKGVLHNTVGLFPPNYCEELPPKRVLNVDTRKASATIKRMQTLLKLTVTGNGEKIEEVEGEGVQTRERAQSMVVQSQLQPNSKWHVAKRVLEGKRMLEGHLNGVHEEEGDTGRDNGRDNGYVEENGNVEKHVGKPVEPAVEIIVTPPVKEMPSESPEVLALKQRITDLELERLQLISEHNNDREKIQEDFTQKLAVLNDILDEKGLIIEIMRKDLEIKSEENKEIAYEMEIEIQRLTQCCEELAVQVTELTHIEVPLRDDRSPPSPPKQHNPPTPRSVPSPPTPIPLDAEPSPTVQHVVESSSTIQHALESSIESSSATIEPLSSSSSTQVESSSSSISTTLDSSVASMDIDNPTIIEDTPIPSPFPFHSHAPTPASTPTSGSAPPIPSFHIPTLMFLKNREEQDTKDENNNNNPPSSENIENTEKTKPKADTENRVTFSDNTQASVPPINLFASTKRFGSAKFQLSGSLQVSGTIQGSTPPPSGNPNSVSPTSAQRPRTPRFNSFHNLSSLPREFLGSSSPRISNPNANSNSSNASNSSASTRPVTPRMQSSPRLVMSTMLLDPPTLSRENSKKNLENQIAVADMDAEQFAEEITQLKKRIIELEAERLQMVEEFKSRKEKLQEEKSNTNLNTLNTTSTTTTTTTTTTESTQEKPRSITPPPLPPIPSLPSSSSLSSSTPTVSILSSSTKEPSLPSLPSLPRLPDIPKLSTPLSSNSPFAQPRPTRPRNRKPETEIDTKTKEPPPKKEVPTVVKELNWVQASVCVAIGSVAFFFAQQLFDRFV